MIDGEEGTNLNELAEKNKEAINAYRDLKKISIETAGFSADTTLSFIIDQSQKEKSDKWQEDINSLSDLLSASHKEEGQVGSLWVLADRSAKDYIQFLNNKLLSPTTGEKEKQGAEILIRIVTKMLDANKSLYESQKKSSPVIIPPDYAPEWRKAV